MHGPARVFIVLSAFLSLLATGCATAPTGLPSGLRTVFVADPVGRPSPDFRMLDDAIHDESVRALRRLGYVDAREAGDAQAVLRSAWQTAPNDAQGRERWSLSFRLEDVRGRPLADLGSGNPLPTAFWSTPRAIRETDERLARLPKAGGDAAVRPAQPGADGSRPAGE